jgi:hypothetical protein
MKLRAFIAGDRNMKIDLDEKHYAAIGRVAASWALLEHAIDFSIVCLVSGHKDDGFCITSQVIGAANKMKALIALLRRNNFDKAADKIDLMMKKLYNLSDRRNRIVHDVGTRHEKTGAHFRYEIYDKIQGAALQQNIPVDLIEIDKLVADIHKRRKEFVTFWMNIPNRPGDPGSFPSTSILLQ